MSWLSRLLRRNRVEKHLDAELRDHIERQVAEYMAEGATEPAARRRASLEFGGLDQIKELCRDARGTRWFEDFSQDIRYGSRIFRRNPSFAIAAVLSLTLGIGANTAIFTLVDATMLKPLPVREPDAARRAAPVAARSRPGHRLQRLFIPGAGVPAEHATTVEIIASHQSDFFFSAENAPAEHSKAQYVTGDFFPVLGVPALYGRIIQPDDDRAEAAPVIVLSHRFWQARFGGARSVIGETVRLDGHLFTVAGVAPPSFRGLIVAKEVDFWVPLWSERLLQTPSQTSDAGYNWLQLVGRVRPGRSLEAARAELSALFYAAVVEPKLALVTDPDRAAQFKAWRPVVESARTGLAIMRQQYGEPLVVLLSISGLVLLIACVNVANLLLARANSRRHEVAVRLSLGAGRARIIRQLLTESVLLSAAGAALGVMLAYLACEHLVQVLAVWRNPIALSRGPGSARPHLRRCARARNIGAVRPRAGMANVFAGRAGHIAPEWQSRGGSPRSRGSQSSARRNTGCALGDHALLRRALPAVAEQPPIRRKRLRHRRRADLQRRCVDRPARRRLLALHVP